VISVAVQGKDKDEIVVVGNEVDSAGLCTALRKKVGYAVLISVEEVKDPKPEEKKPEEKKPDDKKPEEKKPDQDKKQAEEKKPDDKKDQKKQEENPQEKKKDEQKDAKKSETTPCPPPHCHYNYPPPNYNYPPPPPNYCHPNHQLYMYTVPPDENPICRIM